MAESATPNQRTKATLPLFPLHSVLLPGTNLPLHIFEPRYRQLVVDLASQSVPSSQFGIVGIKTPDVHEVERPDQVEAIGCSAVLREAERLPDGRFDIITKGNRRFRLLDIDAHSAPYLMGTVEWIADGPLPTGGHPAATVLSTVARTAHSRYCESAWERDDWSTPPNDIDLNHLAYVLAEDCLLPLADRQLLLEETHPLRRLRMVSRMLTRETGFLNALRAVPAPPADLVRLGTKANLN